jgi:hypothetical protein
MAAGTVSLTVQRINKFVDSAITPVGCLFVKIDLSLRLHSSRDAAPYWLHLANISNALLEWCSSDESLSAMGVYYCRQNQRLF